MIKIRRLRRNRKSNRGSALLVSLMVIVGLSLLGLGFVAISETESAIAKNQQNALQTQAIAEAGARVVVEWFQDPTWAETNAALPLNGTAPAGIKATRIVGMNVAAPDYAGVYKLDVTKKLCDKPYRPKEVDRFYGDQDLRPANRRRNSQQCRLLGRWVALWSGDNQGDGAAISESHRAHRHHRRTLRPVGGRRTATTDSCRPDSR